ncbi:thioesterase domain-containing protein [Bombilactobacillus bombi]|uniref:thioesterase domain-containing protein n=1 Tax=Bombilactobacillus bombi TaxID=1303590 RepID=UPI0015E62A23|nr:thioesterase domain-containing protein [Bombilactobacillus bombi]MBA1434319.1 hypothetical protein [Bombilactobacillus bombi]
MKSVQKIDSYDIGGLPFGGVTAFETARQLQKQGFKVNPLVILESIFIDDEMRNSWMNLLKNDLTKDRAFRVMNLLLSISNGHSKIALIKENELDKTLPVDKFMGQLVNIAIAKAFERD